jgi:hypothetical protein
MKKIIFSFAIIIGLFYWFGRDQPHQNSDFIPSVDWITMTEKDDPIQVNLKNKDPMKFGEYSITPLAEFNIAARVLGTEPYRMGREAELSPVDFALGWGPMTEDKLVDTLTIRQSNRWYYWRTSQFISSSDNISHHSANMHMIPANSSIESQLKTVDKGDHIQISGYLVQVRHPDGYYWRSSTSRTDTGQGACEVILVTGIRPI